MDRRISTTAAPAALGPYSQGIAAGELVLCSGQLGLDPTTGELLEGVEAQAGQALRNLGAVLAVAGLGYADVAKTTIFLADMADFAAVNAVYAAFFAEPYPARSTVAVAALPKGGRIEVEALAVRPSKVDADRAVTTSSPPRPDAPRG
jgi:2-iminobutanoate/2-iminopropanoate deaminase